MKIYPLDHSCGALSPFIFCRAVRVPNFSTLLYLFVMFVMLNFLNLLCRVCIDSLDDIMLSLYRGLSNHYASSVHDISSLPLYALVVSGPVSCLFGPDE